jgi:hypothetical protein
VTRRRRLLGTAVAAVPATLPGTLMAVADTDERWGAPGFPVTHLRGQLAADSNRHQPRH